MLLQKSRIYEKHIFHHIFSLPIDFSSKINFRNSISNLCKKSKNKEVIKYLDFFFLKDNYLAVCIDYVFNKPIEHWIAARYNIDLAANIKDYRFPTDFLCCVRCKKYFTTHYVDDGGICPRKGCNSIYSLGCSCGKITHPQKIIETLRYEEEEYSKNEEENEDYDVFKNKLKNPRLNTHWKLLCTKCDSYMILYSKMY